MVFQSYALWPHMSVRDNVAFGVRERPVPTADAKRRVGEVLDLVGLAHLAESMPNQLSGGQQQRLCIARTLAVEPEVVLMDEPCSALDPIATVRIEETISELKNDYTIVIVTHNLQQAARISDYTAFFYLGRLVEFNQTKQMFTQPNLKQTEDYVTGRFG